MYETDVLTYEEKRVRDSCCTVVCCSLCLHTHELQACCSQGVFVSGCVMWMCVRECLCLLSVNEGRTFKVEPVCLLQVKYSFTWLALFSPVRDYRANSMDWLISVLKLFDTTSTTPMSDTCQNTCSMDPEVSVIYIFCSVVNFIQCDVWSVRWQVLIVSGWLHFRFQVPSSK